MPIITAEKPHGINCVQKDSYGDCYHDYAEWLIGAAPDVLWYDIQEVGSYQGQVFGVGLYKRQVAIYEDYYGSCSGCGAWGEGGEPTSQEEVLNSCTLFSTKEEALEYVKDQWESDRYRSEYPDLDKMKSAIEEVFSV